METFIPIDLTVRKPDVDKKEHKPRQRHLRHKDQRCKDGTPSESQPAEVTAKRMSSGSWKTEGAEGIYEDYHPGYLEERFCQQCVVASKSTVPVRRKSKKNQERSFTNTKAKKARLQSYDRAEPEEHDAIKHIIRLRDKLEWKTPVFPPNLKYLPKIVLPKCGLKEPLKDDGEFVYCLPLENTKGIFNEYDLQVVSAYKAKNSKEFWMVTASFVSKITKTGTSTEDVELTPTLDWLLERHCFYLLQQFKIFYNFRMNKAFVTWKLNVKRIKTEKSRAYLYDHLFLADELFQSCLLYVRGLFEDALNLKKNSEDNPSAICLIKLDTSRTYVLDKFCEEQIQQANQAVVQLEEIKTKATAEIKSTILKVAEKKDVKEYFESKPSEIDTTHFKLPQYRCLLETNLRFLRLIDYLLQELIRQLMNSAVSQLLELFIGSARMPFSKEKINISLMRTRKIFSRKISNDDEEFINSNVSPTPVQNSEPKPDTDTDVTLNRRKVEINLRKTYAPIFEVNLCMKTPSSNESPEESDENGQKSEQDLEETLSCDDDEPSESQRFVKNPSEDPLMKYNQPSKFGALLRRILSDTGLLLDSAQGHIYNKFSEFPTNLFIQPNRLDFSTQFQNLLATIEKYMTTIIPFHQDPRLSTLTELVSVPDLSNETESIIKYKKQTRWPDFYILFETDANYQNKLFPHHLTGYFCPNWQYDTECPDSCINFIHRLSYLKQIVTMAIEMRLGIFCVKSLDYQLTCLPYVDNTIEMSYDLLRYAIEGKNANLLK
ncbi:hypothetical protein STEG23_030202, partial [Scotinomys teguina]